MRKYITPLQNNEKSTLFLKEISEFSLMCSAKT